MTDTQTDVTDAPERQAGRDVLGRPAGHVVRPEDRKPIVTNWRGMDDWSNCPPDYETWYRQYRSETYYWVSRAGVNPREYDDIVNEIMTRFMERDSLGVFDPTFANRSATGRSQFRSYYSNFVVGYASGKHRNQVRYLKKHALVFDAKTGDGESTWGEVFAPAQVDAQVDAAAFALAIDAVRARCGAELVDAVLYLATSGSVPQKQLSELLGTTVRGAKTGLDAVRGALRDALAEVDA